MNTFIPSFFNSQNKSNMSFLKATRITTRSSIKTHAMNTRSCKKLTPPQDMTTRLTSKTNNEQNPSYSTHQVVVGFDEKIDFDDAHNCWVENKRKINGQYVYTCGYILKNMVKCRNRSFDKIGLCSGCKTHYMWEEKINKHDLD